MTTVPDPNDGQTMPNVTPTAPRVKANGRAATTNRPQARIDGNSATGRRIRDLYRALMKRLDNPTDIVVQADVLALAELKTVAEAARLRLLEGTDKRSDECVRLENLVRRAEARIGLAPIGQAEEPGHPYGILFETEEESSSEE
jgi:hypothetical protein